MVRGNEMMGGQRAGTQWMIIYVVVFWTCVDESAANDLVSWSPDMELHHMAVDPVSGKVTQRNPEPLVDIVHS